MVVEVDTMEEVEDTVEEEVEATEVARKGVVWEVHENNKTCMHDACKCVNKVVVTNVK